MDEAFRTAGSKIKQRECCRQSPGLLICAHFSLLSQNPASILALTSEAISDF
jgi:hypothetical protein